MIEIKVSQLGPVQSAGAEGAVAWSGDKKVGQTGSHSPDCLKVELGNSGQDLQGFSLECQRGCGARTTNDTEPKDVLIRLSAHPLPSPE